MDATASTANSVVERVRIIAERVARSHGLEIVHVETARGGNDPVLRIFIDKPEGVTLGDCSTLSEHVGAILDVEDLVASAYTLEVSSPGLERGLYKLADYERFANRAARIKSRIAVDGQRNFRGSITGVEDDNVIFQDRTRGNVVLPFAEIVKANLEIDTEEEFRRAKELSEKNRRESGDQTSEIG